MKKRMFSVLIAVVMFISLIFSIMPVSAAVTLVWPVPGHKDVSQSFHDGNAIDISDGTISGATIVAALGGTVTHKYTCTTQHYGSLGDCDGFGTGLVIAGTDGRIYQYAHMTPNSIPSNIYVGATVSSGQKIGTVGTTGNSSGSHLHFGISIGNFYNASGINPSNENYVDSSTPGSQVDLGTDFFAYIINTASWKLLTNDTFNVCIKQETAEAKQVWYFERQPNGSYKITNCLDRNVLDAHDFGTANGTNVAVAANNDSTAQRWYIYGESGAYYLRPQYANIYLDVTENSSKDGTNVQLYEQNNTSAQKFQIWKLNTPEKANITCTVGTSLTPTLFKWEKTANTNVYNVRIWKDKLWQGAEYATKWGITETQWSVILPEGTYEAYIDSVNYFSYTGSNIVRFTVEKGNISPAPSTSSTSGKPQQTSKPTNKKPSTSTSSSGNKTVASSTAPVTAPKAPLIKKLQKGKKAFTATWSKISGVSGYQIKYTTDKKFKKDVKSKTVTAKTTKLKIKKLKSKKTYYVKIRAYKTVNGTKIYSKYCTVKKIKVK